MTELIKMIELFSGIGAQERALRQLGLPYEVINTCDCDANAVLSYAAMRWDLEKEMETFEFPSQDEMVKELQDKNLGYDFQKGKHTITSRTPISKLKQYYIADKLSQNLGDISKVDKLPYADLVTYSYPCTDLSVAGKGEGMVIKCDKCEHTWPIDFEHPENNNACPKCGNIDIASTRSGLLGQVQRLLTISYEDGTLPRYLLLENVKNLVGKKFKPQFDAWVNWLDLIGYNTYYKVLNSKHYGIPQNRERIFAISIRKDVDTSGFTFPEQIQLETRLKDVLEKSVDERYYLPDDRIEKILNSTFMQEKKRIQMTDVCDTLLARDWKDPKCVPVEEEPEVHQIMNVCPTKTRDNPNQGRVYDVNGIAPTLTKMDGGNREPMVLDEIKVIGNYMPSNHDASRVVDIDGIAPTVKENHGTVTAIAEPFIVASRGRNPENPSDRTTGAPTEQRLEPNFSGCTNTLTSVQKDNYVCEPQVLRAERTEYGKAIRKQYEAGEIDEKIGNMREMKPRTDGVANTITTLLKDNYVAEPIIYDDYNSRISSDQDAINTLTCNCGASAERNGVKIIEPIVCEERKDEGIRLFKDDCVGTLRTIDACGDKRVIEPKLEFVGGLGDKDWAKDGKQLSRNYPQGSRVYSSDGIASALTAQGVGGAGGFSGLYTVSENIKWRIRKLMPVECWKLMAFSREDHNRAVQYVSNSALYKQAGNSIVVNVLVALMSSLFIEDGHKSEVWTKYSLNPND
jgi:DNA (cytosine-5)-methyltransferase 1